MYSVNYAFPDYDDVLPMLEGFTDISYKNDSCPSMHKELLEDIYLVLYCDYKDNDRRESPNGFRYQLALDMPMILMNAKFLLMSDDIMEVKHFIDNHIIDDFIKMKDITLD
jgi:hypothetical protein